MNILLMDTSLAIGHTVIRAMLTWVGQDALRFELSFLIGGGQKYVRRQKVTVPEGFINKS